MSHMAIQSRRLEFNGVPGSIVHGMILLGTRDGKRYDFKAECNRSLKNNVFLTGKDKESVNLTLEGDTAFINGQFDGKLDPSYKPETRKNFVRYTGFNAFNFPETTSVFIEKPLLEGGKAGKMIIEISGETYETATYNCYLH